MTNQNLVDFPRRTDHRLHAIANAADLAIMHEEHGIFEIHFPDVTLDQQAIVEIAQALSRMKLRQVQAIDILADELLDKDASEIAH